MYLFFDKLIIIFGFGLEFIIPGAYNLQNQSLSYSLCFLFLHWQWLQALSKEKSIDRIFFSFLVLLVSLPWDWPIIIHCYLFPLIVTFIGVIWSTNDEFIQHKIKAYRYLGLYFRLHMFEVELAECHLMLYCEYLRPSLSDEDCVLHLGRPPTVLGQVGPAIIQHSDLETLLRKKYFTPISNNFWHWVIFKLKYLGSQLSDIS